MGDHQPLGQQPTLDQLRRHLYCRPAQVRRAYLGRRVPADVLPHRAWKSLCGGRRSAERE